MYTYDAITISQEPYIVTFKALNPDRPEYSSEIFTLTLYVVTNCYIAFEDKFPGNISYDVTIEKVKLNETVPVVTVGVISNCNGDDVTYEILKEIYQSSKIFALFLIYLVSIIFK